MNNDLISREALKEDFEERNKVCDKWIEEAKDEETKIRAEAIKLFIREVIMTIDNAPTVETGHYLTNCQNCKSDYSRGYDDGYKEGYKAEKPTGKWNKCFDKKDYFIGWTCSNCEKICKGIYNYCPNCGAKMDGGES